MKTFALLLCFILSIFCTPYALATKEWALKTRKRCRYCHITVAADAPLNPLGRKFRRQGHSFALKDSKLENSSSKGPLTETEQKLLLRKYLLKGKRLFELDKIGHKKVSCSDCHDKDLNSVWQRYPRYHSGLKRMAWSGPAAKTRIEQRVQIINIL